MAVVVVAPRARAQIRRAVESWEREHPGERSRLADEVALALELLADSGPGDRRWVTRTPTPAAARRRLPHLLRASHRAGRGRGRVARAARTRAAMTLVLAYPDRWRL